MSIFSQAEFEFPGNYTWQCFIFTLAGVNKKKFCCEFFVGSAIRNLSEWFWHNMNGNIIYYIPPPLGDFSEHTYIKEKTFLEIEWDPCDDFMSSAYSLSLSLFFFLVHPVISLVMWEWSSCDNSTFLFHMRQEDSLQALTCFSTGESNASCHLLHLNSCQSYISLSSSVPSWFSLVPGHQLSEVIQALLSIK